MFQSNQTFRLIFKSGKIEGRSDYTSDESLVWKEISCRKRKEKSLQNSTKKK
jgi:hypothetical protein